MKPLSKLIVPLALCLSGCLGPSLEGKYADTDGNGVEFVKGGDILLYHNDQQFASGRWSKLEDDRVSLRFDGIAGFMGVQACNFKFDGGDLVLSNCQLAGTLKRKI